MWILCTYVIYFMNEHFITVRQPSKSGHWLQCISMWPTVASFGLFSSWSSSWNVEDFWRGDTLHSLLLKTDLCASLKQNKLKQECFQVYVLNNCFRLQKKLCYHCTGNTNGLQAKFTSGFLIFLLWKKFVRSGALNFITGHTPVVSRKSNAHFMPIYVATRANTLHFYLTPYVR